MSIILKTIGAYVLLGTASGTAFCVGRKAWNNEPQNIRQDLTQAYSATVLMPFIAPIFYRYGNVDVDLKISPAINTSPKTEKDI